MKTFTSLLTSIVMAAWVGAIAVFSIQNIEAVSLKFLTFASIQIPVGVLLSFCLGAGMILGAIVPLLLPQPKRNKRGRLAEDDLEEFEF
ncbi:MAG: LapA family protein [Hydrococcus sp. C42_A2020_068]|nr:LapA family protein [Hydrococcus sp. C42_A2020_068]